MALIALPRSQNLQILMHQPLPQLIMDLRCQILIQMKDLQVFQLPCSMPHQEPWMRVSVVLMYNFNLNLHVCNIYKHFNKLE